MALPSTKVEVAFNAGFTTPAASRTWTDVSAYVLGQFPVSITRGRQDEVSQAPPSRLSVVLNNIDGRFTPEKTAGAYYPNVKLGRPIRVTVTYNAVNYVRFLGFIDDWAPTWPDGTSADSITTVTASSRLARLGKDASLRSIVEEEILLDGPSAYYTLGDPAESSVAADSSGNQAPSLVSVGGNTAVTFGVTGPVGNGAGTAAQYTVNGKYMAPAAAISYNGLSCFFAAANGSTNVGILPDFANPSGFSVILDGSGQLRWGTTGVSSLGPYTVDTYYLFLDRTNGKLYINGSLIGTDATSNTFYGYPVSAGVFSHIAGWTTIPSTTRMTAHATAGIAAFNWEMGGARITRYASYAGVAATEVAVDTGIARIGASDTTGNAAVDMIRKVETTEGGVVYDAKDGTLTFKDRDARYNTAAAFTLNATSQEVEADLEPKYDFQFLVNDIAASANGAPAGRAYDATSNSDYGNYSSSLETITDDLIDALAGAQWKVGLGKDPRSRYGQVTVDVVNSSTSQAAAVMSAEIGTRFDLAGLPSQAPATTAELFAEGYEEVVTSATHTVRFNTSPTYGYTGTGSNGVWQLGVAGRSELGDTTRLAF